MTPVKWSVLSESHGGQQAAQRPEVDRSLFEVVVRLLFEQHPTRLHEFVMFAAGVCNLRQETFLRAVRALPAVVGLMSDDSARVCASLHTSAGDPCAAIDVLASNRLWDSCIALIEDLADGGMMHFQVFKLVLQRMLEAGVFLDKGMPLLQNQQLVPPTFTAGDLFEQFSHVASNSSSTASVTCSRPEDVAIGSIRELLTSMMDNHRDLLTPRSPLSSEMV